MNLSRQIRRQQEREAAKRTQRRVVVPADLALERAYQTLDRMRVARTSIPTENKPDKGLFDGSCNRTACQRPIAGNNWFNTSTRAYYCERCADLIDDWGTRRGEPRMCVAVTTPDEQPPFD